ALLVAADDAVAAALDLAVIGAAVATDGVAVVALLAGLSHAVPALRRVGEAGERDPVVRAVAGRVLHAGRQRAPAARVGRVRDTDVHGRRPVIGLTVRRAGEEDRIARLDRR